MNTYKLSAYILIIIISFGCEQKQYQNTVVSGHPEATKIGIQVLEDGGNAIDASIAVQLALAVCLPSAGNIGGGGFMIFRESNGKVSTLDFREKAPKKSTKKMYLDYQGNIIDSLSTHGGLSVGVPGTIDGIFEAHRKFGSIKIENLFQYAIDLAMNGFTITKIQADNFNYFQKDFKKFNPNNNYFQNRVWKKGDTLKQYDLANTLSIIRDLGRDGFYKGTIANSIVSTIKDNGIISLKDLEDYKAIWREPILLNFKNYTLISMPPPSSGGIAISQLLMMLLNFETDSLQHNSTQYIHMLSEIEKIVYADRSKHLGDNDFYKVSANNLLDTIYIKTRVLNINLNKATPSDSIYAGTFSINESEETTHFSIVDKNGNAVSVTTTLNSSYGSKVFVNNGGFLLNNEMDDFSSKPGSPNIYGLLGSEANSIEPEKRMLSSMTPTIIEKEGELFMVLGSPGGSTIITSVFQTILNTILFNMDIQNAVDMPRFHHQWKPEKIYIEATLHSDTLIKELNNLGHVVQTRSPIGHVNAIIYNNGEISFGADHRGDNHGEISNK